jgi:hypothetical protein
MRRPIVKARLIPKIDRRRAIYEQLGQGFAANAGNASLEKLRAEKGCRRREG